MKKYLIIILICLIGISSSGCAVTQVLEIKQIIRNTLRKLVKNSYDTLMRKM